MNKRIIIFLLLLAVCATSFAQYNVQSKYFVYLQTEPAQPFYIKISGQQLSANASGYLILPQLKDGDYKMLVGFPAAKYPEQIFNFKIDSKDKGYLIKDFGAEGWGLFDLQTMIVQKPLTAEALAAIEKAKVHPPQARPAAPKADVVPKTETAAAPPPTSTNVDSNASDFTKMLSKAANDPSLLEKPKVEEKVVEKPIVVAATVDTKEIAASNTAQPEIAKEPVKEKNTPARKVPATETSISKLSQSETGEAINAVYEDKKTDGSTEQIAITIPLPVKTVTAAVEPAPAATADSEKFKVAQMPALPQSDISKEKEDIKKEVAVSETCKSVASEEDFLALRRKMAQRENDDTMIQEAQRAFRNKCYTTAQIKYLSSMFLSNAGKYNFYEAAFTHIADPENFATLQSEIKDSFYKDKFNLLISK